MANADQIFGLIPITNNPTTTTLTAGGTFAEGDIVMLGAGTGEVVVFDSGAGSLAAGVAATSGTDGEDCIVYTNPETEFRIQCDSGTAYVKADHDLIHVDITGGTGAMEADLDSTTDKTLMVIGHYPMDGSEDVGTNAIVRVKISQHLFASTPSASSAP